MLDESSKTGQVELASREIRDLRSCDIIGLIVFIDLNATIVYIVYNIPAKSASSDMKELNDDRHEKLQCDQVVYQVTGKYANEFIELIEFNAYNASIDVH